eukprot:CAMPEP_0194042570 /NCGR_PEP_ID=MMETSP0009_2-20130614/14331_1 /TAXON_ID=210454 /ORGANISM="Grammatophora oceanica, Strain CCMP 410" /LENGTH=142 /DNA_ID=CAMNT_0038686463 /DNA_START=29 /DNA_END=454 /DNA_ORIENTATION=-
MDIQTKEEGRSKAASKRAGMAEKQLSAAGSEVLLNNTYNIMLQASLRGMNALDSVVFIDFTSLKPKIVIITQEEFLADTAEEGRDHHASIFERNRRSGAISAACCNGTHVLVKTLPAESAPIAFGHLPRERRWRAAQERVDT